MPAEVAYGYGDRTPSPQDTGKVEASGRSVEAEAAAILSASLEGENLESQLTPPSDMDELQRMVWEAYGGKLPGNVVDEFLAERKRMCGED